MIIDKLLEVIGCPWERIIELTITHMIIVDNKTIISLFNHKIWKSL